MLVFCGLFLSALSLNSFCLNSTCQNCAYPKLNFNSSNCLDICPKGFEPIENNSKCKFTSGERLFNVGFYRHYN